MVLNCQREKGTTVFAKNVKSGNCDFFIYKLLILYLIRDGTQLHMFLVKQAEEVYSQVPTLLFLHGNAGNIGHRSFVMEMYCQMPTLLFLHGNAGNIGHR